MEYTDIIGKRFGQLTVVEFTAKDKVGKQQRNRYLYECKCDCGGSKVIDRVNLITNHTTSCGCLKRRTLTSPSWTGYKEISGSLWAHIKNHALKRGIPVEITIEDAWDQFVRQNRCCALTGIELFLYAPHDRKSRRTASLDRIDNNGPYSRDNIQWVHKEVNWMKGFFSQTRFVELCRLVANYASGIGGR